MNKVSIRQFNEKFWNVYSKPVNGNLLPLHGTALIAQYRVVFNKHYGSGSYNEYYHRQFMTWLEYKGKTSLDHGIHIPMHETPLCDMVDTIGNMGLEVAS